MPPEVRKAAVELFDYVRVLRRRWLVLLLAILVTTGGAIGASLHQKPLYQSSSRLIVSGSSQVSAVDEISRRQLAVQRATAYSQIASTGPAIQAALLKAGYPASANRPGVTASADGSSPFVTLTVTSRDSQQAQRVAGAMPFVLPDVVTQLDQVPSAVKQELSVVDAASDPVKTRPKPVRDGGIGLALGLLLGVGLVLMRESLDRSFVDPDKLEDATGRTVLGVVPQELSGKPLPSVTHPESGRAEAYRQVRTNIQFAGPEHTLKTIVITSATAGEGKTTLAANLAVSFAQTGESVAIVDADLRRPKVTEAFGLPSEGPGLSSVLAGVASLVDCILPVDTSDGVVAVLPAGPQPHNPSELLGSSVMAGVLDELAERYDVVIIDSPPILPVTDPLVLAVHSTALVVVVRLGSTSRDALLRSLASIDKLNVPLLGLVANGSVPSGDAAYGYRYGYARGGKNSRKVNRPASTTIRSMSEEQLT